MINNRASNYICWSTSMQPAECRFKFSVFTLSINWQDGGKATFGQLGRSCQTLRQLTEHRLWALSGEVQLAKQAVGRRDCGRNEPQVCGDYSKDPWWTGGEEKRSLPVAGEGAKNINTTGLSDGSKRNKHIWGCSQRLALLIKPHSVRWRQVTMRIRLV